MPFVRKHKLNVESSPVHWFQAFLPVSNRDIGSGSYSLQHCLMWTNTRATLESAGIGGKYSDFTSFSLPELMQHIGLYLLQALSPSPQVDMKFCSQKDDPVNGNDLIHTSFGGKAATSQRRHRHFKSFFASNDPCHPVPSRDEAPNWKVHPFLKHILKVSQEAVFMGRDLSCDEQTIGFKGIIATNKQILTKKRGMDFLQIVSVRTDTHLHFISGIKPLQKKSWTHSSAHLYMLESWDSSLNCLTYFTH